MTDRPISLDACIAADTTDPLARFRDEFRLPPGVIYLDGNSLGALPARTPGRIADVVEREWGTDLIRSWVTNGWIEAATRVGGKIARLIGAQRDEVVVADSTSVNLFKLVSAALLASPGRGKVLSEPGNFPTDLYVIEGAVRATGGGRRLELCERGGIADAIDADTALVVLTHVHYKTAEMFDMAAITARAHAMGALVLWDLSHSAGAVPLDLNGARADLAVGCGYKYLNGGPGAPAFLYVAERHNARLISPLSGWMGHAEPFAFEDGYRPAPGIARFLCGTPSVLGVSALEAGVDLLLEADFAEVARKSQRLCALFAALVAQECGGFGLEPVGPGPESPRGSHVSFRHPQGYAIVQAMIARGVIGDFRAPDVLRFGFTPLYLGHQDVWHAVRVMREVLEQRLWDRAEYRARAAVT